MTDILYRAICTKEVHTHHEGTEVGAFIEGYLVEYSHIRTCMSEECGGFGPGIVHVDVPVDYSTLEVRLLGRWIKVSELGEKICFKEEGKDDLRK